jgi:hypothetical protein
MGTFSIYQGHSYLSIYDNERADQFSFIPQSSLRAYLSDIDFSFENCLKKNCIESAVTIHSILALNILVLTDFSAGFRLPEIA